MNMELIIVKTVLIFIGILFIFLASGITKNESQEFPFGIKGSEISVYFKNRSTYDRYVEGNTNISYDIKKNYVSEFTETK